MRWNGRSSFPFNRFINFGPKGWQVGSTCLSNKEQCIWNQHSLTDNTVIFLTNKSSFHSAILTLWSGEHLPFSAAYESSCCSLINACDCLILCVQLHGPYFHHFLGNGFLGRVLHHSNIMQRHSYISFTIYNSLHKNLTSYLQRCRMCAK